MRCLSLIGSDRLGNKLGSKLGGKLGSEIITGVAHPFVLHRTCL